MDKSLYYSSLQFIELLINNFFNHIFIFREIKKIDIIIY